jgi:cell division protein FtsB
MTDGPRRRPRPTGAKASTRRAPAKKAPAKKSAAKRAPAKKPAAKRAPARSTTAKRARRPFGRMAAGLVVSVVLVGFLLVGVFPTRTWLAQREETKDRQAELDRIRAEQAVHEDRITELKDPDEIEAAARRDHGLTMPGETAIQMLPRPVPAVDLPDTWPFTGADDWLNR